MISAPCFVSHEPHIQLMKKSEVINTSIIKPGKRIMVTYIIFPPWFVSSRRGSCLTNDHITHEEIRSHQYRYHKTWQKNNGNLYNLRAVVRVSRTTYSSHVKIRSHQCLLHKSGQKNNGNLYHLPPRGSCPSRRGSCLTYHIFNCHQTR